MDDLGFFLFALPLLVWLALSSVAVWQGRRYLFQSAGAFLALCSAVVSMELAGSAVDSIQETRRISNEKEHLSLLLEIRRLELAQFEMRLESLSNYSSSLRFLRDAADELSSEVSPPEEIFESLSEINRIIDLIESEKERSGAELDEAKLTIEESLLELKDSTLELAEAEAIGQGLVSEIENLTFILLLFGILQGSFGNYIPLKRKEDGVRC